MSGPTNSKVQVTVIGGGPLSGEALNDTTASSGGGSPASTLSNRDFTGNTITDTQSALDSSSLGTSNTLTTNATAHSVLSNQSLAVQLDPGAEGTWDADQFMYVTRLNLSGITGTWSNAAIGVGLKFSTTWVNAWAFKHSGGDWEASITSGTGNVGSGGDDEQSTEPSALLVYWYVDSITEVSVMACLLDSDENILSQETMSLSIGSVTAPADGRVMFHDNSGYVKSVTFTVRDGWVEIPA